MKKILILLANLLNFTTFSFCQEESKPLNEYSFTQEFYQKLKEKLPEVELDSMENLYILLQINESQGFLYLDNAYSEYLNAPEEKEIVFDRYIQSTIATFTKNHELSKDNIVPNIKDIRFLDALREMYNGSPTEAVYEKYNEDLYIIYAFDSEDGIRYMQETELAELELKVDSLKSLAVSNLDRLLPKIEVSCGDGYYMLLCGGDYEASLILFDDFWTKENFPVKGEIVVGVPSRDLLLVTGSDDEANLNKLKELIIDINSSGDHLISEKLFILKNGKFEVFD